MEVGKQRMCWARMNSTFLVCRVVLPGNESTGEQIFVCSVVWALGAGRGCWNEMRCFCLGCCEQQLKQSTERAGLCYKGREQRQVEAMTTSARGWIHGIGPLAGKDLTHCSKNLCIAVTITDKSCAFLLIIMEFKCHFLLAVTGDCLPNFSSVIFFFLWPKG